MKTISIFVNIITNIVYVKLFSPSLVTLKENFENIPNDYMSKP